MFKHIQPFLPSFAVVTNYFTRLGRLEPSNVPGEALTEAGATLELAARDDVCPLVTEVYPLDAKAAFAIHDRLKQSRFRAV